MYVRISVDTSLFLPVNDRVEEGESTGKGCPIPRQFIVDYVRDE